ncbi:MAG: apolipoprotein N-acyltransferase [Acetobacteraceae bacterium]|nr:apolipoprotein N-acyltransferase [Acetobacteraceae bacterium]
MSSKPISLRKGISGTTGGAFESRLTDRLVAQSRRILAARPDAAAFALGLFSAASLPPFHLVFVLLFAVPGLIALIDRARGPAATFRLGWWFGFGHHLVGLYWITEAILIEAARFWWFVPIAVPALSAVLAAFIGAATSVARLAPVGWRRVLALAGGWVLADLVRQFAFTGFPWNPWGSVWEFPGTAGDIFIQLAAILGVHGLTWLTVLLAAAPRLRRPGWIAAGMVLLSWAGFGVWRLSGPAPASPRVAAVLTQGNVPQGEKWDRAQMLATFERYLALTAAGRAQAAAEYPRDQTVVVWPETASPFLLQTDPAARQAIANAARGAITLAGTVRFDERGRPRNSLLAILPNGAADGVYDKWHLVPFGETQPAWLPLPIQIVPGGGFAPGPGPYNWNLPELPPVSALICYEAAYSGAMVDERNRPAWLVNVTNDAWFGNSAGPRQHLAAARLRAVEEGLPLMRAANTGITAGFDAYGRELGRLGMGEMGYLVLALPGALPKPLYASGGLLIPACLGLVSVGVGLVPRRRAGLVSETESQN